MKKVRRWRYKNTVLLILSLLALFLLADTEPVRALLRQVGEYGYAGAFAAGIFFVSTFTVAPATVVLLHLAQDLNHVLMSLCAGAGGALGDLLIFRFIKDGVFAELRPLFRKFVGYRFKAVSRSRYIRWLAPVLGAAIIASPLPDEAGIALMGLSQIKAWQFVILAFVLDAVGIFIVISVAAAFAR